MHHQKAKKTNLQTEGAASTNMWTAGTYIVHMTKKNKPINHLDAILSTDWSANKFHYRT